jgi:hypothetical protein
MEYYDSLNNNKLYNHYCQRNIDLLTNKNVINALENINGKIDPLTNFLEEEPYKIIENKQRHSFIPLRRTDYHITPKVSVSSGISTDKATMVNIYLYSENNL